MNLAIYVHIPFCKQKCKYCDFNSKSGLSEDVQRRYINALCTEIKNHGEDASEYEVSSVYFGGGTPSFIDESLILQVMSEINENYSVKGDAEITIEANPGTVNFKKLSIYKNLGINRISFGVQSMQNRILTEIGRCHSEFDAKESFFAAREAGFNNISLDLMFGLPNQTLKDAEDTLDQFIKMNPEHISAYSLKVEENTAFGALQKQGKLILPSEDKEREMYYLVKDKLKSAGYIHYEISNFAKSGYESRHNLAYWERVPYLGFGVSAASCFNERRFTNVKDISEYIEKVEAGEKAHDEVEVLSDGDIASEKLFLGLRLLKGVPKEYIITDIWKEETKRLIEVGLLKDDGRIKLTVKGLDLANQVFMRYV